MVSAIPALVVALISLIVVLVVSKKEKPSKAMMLLFSAIGSIAALINFPELLAKGAGVDWRIVALVGVVGAFAALVWGIKGNYSGAVITFAGIGAVAWAAFVVVPGGPAAFQYLAEGAVHVGGQLVDLVTGFIAKLKS